MCGIAGYLNLGNESAAVDVLGAMLRNIVHRGPDAQGSLVEGPIALGSTRLSIVDHATGRQPMQSDDGNLVLVFNGEIFNYRELRQQLLSQEQRPFRTESDTEVLLRLFAAKGPAMVHDLNGQWALAIWDKRQKQLFLSRDRVGVRPLHYAHFGKSFVFASEVKAVFAHTEAKRQINFDTLSDILSYWAPLPGKTFFADVYELPPGHSLLVDANGESKLSCYWDWLYPQSKNHYRHVDDAVDELTALLTDAVHLRLRADVPVGAYLSGGLDSALIAALMARAKTPDLSTFSLSFSDREFDEAPYQQRMVEAIGARHHSVACSYQDIGDHFESAVLHAERPLLRTAPAPMVMLSRQVQKAGFKVVLTGEGADEVFAGYDVFREAALRRFLQRHPRWQLATRLVNKLYPYLPTLKSQPDIFKRQFFSADAAPSDDPLYALRPRMRLTMPIHGLLSAASQERIKTFPSQGYLQQLPSDYPKWHPLDQAQYLEAKILMPGYILSSQGDRASMAHAVEGRFPFLDKNVLAFATRLPPHLRLNGLKEKWLLKRAARRFVPTEIIQRPKQPYRSPDVPSLCAGRLATGEPILELLRGERLHAAGVFCPKAVNRLLQRVRDRQQTSSTRDAMALSFVVSTQILVEKMLLQ